MFLFVRELELRKIPFDVKIEPGKIEFSEDELKQVSPLASQGVAELVSATLGEIRIKGTLDVTMEAACDRCLDAAQFPVHAKFDLEYRLDEPGGTGGEVHIDEGETEIGFYEGEGLELEDVLMEQVVLALPMQKVCKADCKGICADCGQNRNVAACDCQPKPVDSRWTEAIRSLKK